MSFETARDVQPDRCLHCRQIIVFVRDSFTNTGKWVHDASRNEYCSPNVARHKAEPIFAQGITINPPAPDHLGHEDELRMALAQEHEMARMIFALYYAMWRYVDMCSEIMRCNKAHHHQTEDGQCLILKNARLAFHNFKRRANELPDLAKFDDVFDAFTTELRPDG